MPLSVRMEPILERELEMAAKRRGITKSQFVIEAVERALGRIDTREMLREVKARYAPLIAAERRATYGVGGKAIIAKPNEVEEPPTTGERVRRVLRAKQDRDRDEPAAPVPAHKGATRRRGAR
jgi:predicted DNA-binding protein